MTACGKYLPPWSALSRFVVLFWLARHPFVETIADFDGATCRAFCGHGRTSVRGRNPSLDQGWGSGGDRRRGTEVHGKTTSRTATDIRQITVTVH
jgi:hypothetical protein